MHPASFLYPCDTAVACSAGTGPPISSAMTVHADVSDPEETQRAVETVSSV